MTVGVSSFEEAEKLFNYSEVMTAISNQTGLGFEHQYIFGEDLALIKA